MRTRRGFSSRLLTRALAGCALIGCVAAATGCGQSAVVAPPTVHVSLTAPTDGATITARKLLVLGTVDPPSAAVTVAGTQVRVANGAFRRWMPLGWGVRRIRVEATAPGYLPTVMRVAVRNATFRVTAVARRHDHRRGAPEPFVARANQACTRAHATNLGAAWSEAGTLTSAHNSPRRVQQLVASGDRLVGRLRRIRVRTASAAAYAAFVDSYQATMNGLQWMLTDAQAQPAKLASDMSALALTFRTAAQRGDALGLHACTNYPLAAPLNSRSASP